MIHSKSPKPSIIARTPYLTREDGADAHWPRPLRIYMLIYCFGQSVWTRGVSATQGGLLFGSLTITFVSHHTRDHPHSASPRPQDVRKVLYFFCLSHFWDTANKCTLKTHTPVTSQRAQIPSQSHEFIPLLFFFCLSLFLPNMWKVQNIRRKLFQLKAKVKTFPRWAVNMLNMG